MGLLMRIAVHRWASGFFTILGLPLLLISTELATGQTQTDRTAHPSEQSIAQLREKAEEVMRLKSNVQVRRQIDVIWALVDRLTESGNTDEAHKYMSFALQHNPWALKYQIQSAEILESKGEKEKAPEKAKIVLEYAETDDLVNRARTILRQHPLPEISKISQVHTDRYTLVLCPVGKVDTCVLMEMMASLQAILDIPVLIQAADITMPVFKRDRLKRIVNDLRNRLIEGLESPGLKPVLTMSSSHRNILLLI